jgi:teichuronic acid biosynthesis glycosyltransferase TuaG
LREITNNKQPNKDIGGNTKVSIVIPFYNCEYIGRSVASALNQSYKNIEVIVVDDGSTKYVELLKPYLNKIIYIRKPNGGTATALNRGISRASGSYVAWLSSDDLFYDNKVKVQLEVMKERNSIFSFTDYIYINKNNTIISPPVGLKKYTKANLLQELKVGCPINGSTVMMKKDLFTLIGQFDESLVYAHDYDYWIRAFLKYDLEYIDQPLTLYRLHPGMGSKRHSSLIIKETEEIQNNYTKRLEDFTL